MNNSNQDSWGSSVEHQGGATDWSAPGHQPPQPGEYPEPYGGGPPAGGGSGGDLETSDIMAIVLSFIIPGLGQLLLGQVVKGLVILGVSLFTCAGFGLLTVASVLDAFLVAKAKKRREVGEWEFFPDFSETFKS